MNKLIKSGVMFAVGFCLYITIEVLFRGYSYPLMGLCGGVLFILLDKINDKLSWNTDLLLQGLLGSGMITLTELIVGEVYKVLHLSPMWDYSDMPLNFDGVICLPFSVAWIFISIVGILLADTINYFVFKDKQIPYYKMFGVTVLKYKGRRCKNGNS